MMLAALALALVTRQAGIGYPPRYALCTEYCALVDGQGKLVGNRLFDRIGRFDGPVAVYEHQGKHGAVDRSGRTVVRPVHDKLWTIGDGFLVAQDSGDDAQKPTYTLFSRNGVRLAQFTGDDFVQFGVWAGHPYYQRNCSDGAPGACAYVFLDGQGKELARFAAFEDAKAPGRAIASADGRSYGLIDASLRFVVAPRYRAIETFNRSVAKVVTAGGVGLIDADGRMIVPPGRYSKLYPWDETPLIDAFAPGDEQCGTYLRPDGRPVHLRKGVCPHGADDLEPLGYAYVIGQRGIGTIDARGKQRVPPRYPWLEGLNRDYLIFGDARKPTRFGLVDRKGHVVLPLQPAAIGPYRGGCCSNPGLLADTLIGAIPGGGVGLLDLHGHWLVPARYRDASVPAAHLVAFEDDRHVYHFFTDQGEPLPLTSAIEPTWVTQPGGPGRMVTIERRVETDTRGGSDTTFLKGLVDRAGRIVVPPDYKQIGPAGEGLWAVTAHIGEQDRVGLIAGDGTMVARPHFAGLVAPFHDGAAVMETTDGDAALIDRQGRTITSFNTLFPDLARRTSVDAMAEQALDICYDPDPAAEPDETAARSVTVRMICADPALRKEARATQAIYLHAQTGNCLPDDFLRLRPAYDRSLAACDDKACLGGAMRAFRAAIAAEGKRCEAAVPSIDAARRSITPAVRALLSKRVGIDEDSDGENGALSFDPLSLGGEQAVIVSRMTGAHNLPFRLFLHQGKAWRQVLTGDAGYLRAVEPTDAIRHGLPVLRTQQHVSCCQHAVSYYAYDGRAYHRIAGCTQIYDTDETAIGLCGKDDDTEGDDQ